MKLFNSLKSSMHFHPRDGPDAGGVEMYNPELEVPGREENDTTLDNKFWDWVRDDAGERVLRLEGPIDEENFWGDEVTPAEFREELESEEGDVTVWICSPGGNVFAAAQIYTMLCEHKGRITVKIDSIAASAASVVAMAGDRVLMSPVAMLMIHSPMTVAMGNAKDMEKAIETLNEVQESIVNAYQKKTGLSRKKISQMMEDETWMNARRAVELGFADEILFSKKTEEPGEESNDEIEASWQPYSTKAMGQRVLNWLIPADDSAAGTDEESIEAAGEEADVEQTGAEVNETAGLEPEEADPAGNTSVNEPYAEKNEEAPPTAEMPDEETNTDTDVELLIGLDGKTKDGAMPYELLIKQLEFLR